MKQFNKTLISDYWKIQNELLHADTKRYIIKKFDKPVVFGGSGYRWLEMVESLRTDDTMTVLDYGCGKATLSELSSFPVQNYDPAVSQYAHLPDPADIVVCTDVLEHIEPEYLLNVIEHLKYLIRVAGIINISTRRDTSKLMPDGSNPHKIVASAEYWIITLSTLFEIEIVNKNESELTLIVRPK